MAWKLLLLVHAMLAVGLLGASTHQGVLAINKLRGGRPKTRLREVYSKTVVWLYAANMVLGALLYPRFRVQVRAAYLDPTLPWATGLFEVKEHWVSIGLVLAIIEWLSRRSFESEDLRGDSTALDIAAVLIMVIVMYSSATGFFLVSLRSV